MTKINESIDLVLGCHTHSHTHTHTHTHNLWFAIYL